MHAAISDGFEILVFSARRMVRERNDLLLFLHGNRFLLAKNEMKRIIRNIILQTGKGAPDCGGSFCFRRWDVWDFRDSDWKESI